MVGPDYRPPQEPLPAAFSATTRPADPAPQTQPAQPLDLTRWWTSLHDPVLDGLIRQAVQSSLDLGIATARIAEARAQRRVVAAGLWPFIGSTTDFGYSRASATLERAHTRSTPRGGLQLREDAGPGGLGVPALMATLPGRHPTSFLITPKPGGPPTVNVRPPLYSPDNATSLIGRDQIAFEAGFDAAWELDVFGGLRRAIEASDADLQGALEARNDVLIVLLADVARTYVELRGFQARLSIAHDNIGVQQRTLDLVNTRIKNGLTNKLDLALAERQLATTQSRVPVLEAQIAATRYRLEVLLAGPPEGLDPFREFSEVPPTIPTGLPSELLENRPDLRRAERELAAATARIGVASADLYPKFTLTGSFAAQTSDISHMLDGNSLIWSAGPGIRWPIFQAGRIVGNVQVQESRTQQALLNYRRTLISAVQEVNQAVANYNGQRNRYLKLREAVDASHRAAHLAQDRYDRGLTDFLNVLDAQRALYDLEDQAASSRQELVSQLLVLYKALGHGWETFALENSPPASQPSGRA